MLRGEKARAIETSLSSPNCSKRESTSRHRCDSLRTRKETLEACNFDNPSNLSACS